MSTEFEHAVEQLAVLADPVRRSMYQFVCSQPRPVSREQVAEGTGNSTKLAAFHLEKLLERGLLEAHYQPPGSRAQGGRPAKLYRRSRREVAVSIPERRYDLMGQILAQAVPIGGEPVRQRARELAYERGRQAGEQHRSERRLRRPGKERTLSAAVEVLAELGFEPHKGGKGEIFLSNCPFDSLAQADPDVVCAANQALVRGVLDGLGGRGVEPSLERAPLRCCVVLRPAP